MTAPDVNPRLQMSRWLWAGLARDLQVRGQGQRESGAFLLAHQRDANRVRSYVLYDDLDSECLTGGISFASSGYTPLWQLCREHGMQVVADVHTHPGHGVGQSDIDRRHPMIPRAGHLALIMPDFAGSRDLRRCGVHVYRGAHRWDRLDESSAREAFSLTWLPLGDCGMRPDDRTATPPRVPAS